MEKVKDLVRRRSRRSLHRKSRSLDQRPDYRPSGDMPSTSGKDLPPVPAVDTTTTHQAGGSTPLRPSSQWGKPAQEQSPSSEGRLQGMSIVPASTVPERENSLRFKRTSPPHIEQDYDQYRKRLAESATGAQKGESDIFHDANEEIQGPVSRTDQQKASREYGRRQIQATDGNDLNIQGLSIAEDGTGTGRALTEPIPMDESNPRSSTDPVANKRNATTHKALPPRPQENNSPGNHTLRHKLSDTDLQEQAQSQSQPSDLPKLDQHPPPSTILPITDDPNHTFSTSPKADPLACLPPSFNPTNTTDTTVDTTVAPAVTHDTHHKQHLNIVQESISRDIHADHYYHYVQPLTAVEVEPARHFRLNSQGEKIPIAAPEGWEMPKDLSVRRAPNFASRDGEGSDGNGGLKWGRRDYVVDEENPRGRMLSAEELEKEEERGHLVSPVGVGAIGAATSGRDSEIGTAT
jgi:hypothetical protein